MGERRECAHSSDADGGDAEDHSAWSRLVVEVGREGGPEGELSRAHE